MASDSSEQQQQSSLNNDDPSYIDKPSQNDAIIIHKTKTIQFFGRSCPIVLQNDNDPCPLLAIYTSFGLDLEFGHSNPYKAATMECNPDRTYAFICFPDMPNLPDESKEYGIWMWSPDMYGMWTDTFDMSSLSVSYHNTSAAIYLKSTHLTLQSRVKCRQCTVLC